MAYTIPGCVIEFTEADLADRPQWLADFMIAGEDAQWAKCYPTPTLRTGGGREMRSEDGFIIVLGACNLFAFIIHLMGGLSVG